MLYTILGIMIAISLVLLIITIYYNKFNFAIIKIIEAENNIDILFDKKKELLERTRAIIKKELKLKEFLEDIEYLNETTINHFEMNNSLKSLHNELNKTLDENEKLYKSEALLSIVEEINSNEEAILGSTKFYNDNVVIFNQLVGSFPSSLVALLWRYKKKEFYNNEKKEMYEILNEK
jgi:LemA protein